MAQPDAKPPREAGDSPARELGERLLKQLEDLGKASTAVNPLRPVIHVDTSALQRRTSVLPGTAPRDVTIFVSSTFVDHHATRRALRERVFPRLSAALARFGLVLRPGEYLWGITETESASGCLERLAEAGAYPYFLYLGGSRFGSDLSAQPLQLPSLLGNLEWPAPSEGEGDAARGAAKLAWVRGASATAMEVLLGGLGACAMARAAMAQPSRREDRAGWHCKNAPTFSDDLAAALKDDGLNPRSLFLLSDASLRALAADETKWSVATDELLGDVATRVPLLPGCDGVTAAPPPETLAVFGALNAALGPDPPSEEQLALTRLILARTLGRENKGGSTPTPPTAVSCSGAPDAVTKLESRVWRLPGRLPDDDEPALAAFADAVYGQLAALIGHYELEDVPASELARVFTDPFVARLGQERTRLLNDADTAHLHYAWRLCAAAEERPQTLGALWAKCDAQRCEGRPAFVCDAPGTGKSVALAQLGLQLSARRPDGPPLGDGDKLLLLHFAGGPPCSQSCEQLAQRIVNALSAPPAPGAAAASPLLAGQALLRRCRELLWGAAEGAAAVEEGRHRWIVVDGADELAGAAQLGWLLPAASASARLRADVGVLVSWGGDVRRIPEALRVTEPNSALFRTPPGLVCDAYAWRRGLKRLSGSLHNEFRRVIGAGGSALDARLGMELLLRDAVHVRLQQHVDSLPPGELRKADLLLRRVQHGPGVTDEQRFAMRLTAALSARARVNGVGGSVSGAQAASIVDALLEARSNITANRPSEAAEALLRVLRPAPLGADAEGPATPAAPSLADLGCPPNATPCAHALAQLSWLWAPHDDVSDIRASHRVLVGLVHAEHPLYCALAALALRASDHSEHGEECACLATAISVDGLLGLLANAAPASRSASAAEQPEKPPVDLLLTLVAACDALAPDGRCFGRVNAANSARRPFALLAALLRRPVQPKGGAIASERVDVHIDSGAAKDGPLLWDRTAVYAFFQAASSGRAPLPPTALHVLRLAEAALARGSAAPLAGVPERLHAPAGPWDDDRLARALADAYIFLADRVAGVQAGGKGAPVGDDARTAAAAALAHVALHRGSLQLPESRACVACTLRALYCVPAAVWWLLRALVGALVGALMCVAGLCFDADAMCGRLTRVLTSGWVRDQHRALQALRCRSVGAGGSVSPTAGHTGSGARRGCGIRCAFESALRLLWGLLLMLWVLLRVPAVAVVAVWRLARSCVNSISSFCVAAAKRHCQWDGRIPNERYKEALDVIFEALSQCLDGSTMPVPIPELLLADGAHHSSPSSDTAGSCH